MQVLPSPRDDEEEPEENRLYRDEGYGINDLAIHLKNLDIWFWPLSSVPVGYAESYSETLSGRTVCAVSD